MLSRCEGRHKVVVCFAHKALDAVQNETDSGVTICLGSWRSIPRECCCVAIVIEGRARCTPQAFFGASARRRVEECALLLPARGDRIRHSECCRAGDHERGSHEICPGNHSGARRTVSEK